MMRLAQRIQDFKCVSIYPWAMEYNLYILLSLATKKQEWHAWISWIELHRLHVCLFSFLSSRDHFAAQEDALQLFASFLLIGSASAARDAEWFSNLLDMMGPWDFPSFPLCISTYTITYPAWTPSRPRFREVKSCAAPALLSLTAFNIP